MYRHLNILVAEDNEHDAFFLKRGFLKAGINVGMQFVKDGQEAVAYLDGTERFQNRAAYPFPNLLILDIKMPKLDGFSVLRHVRQEAQVRKLPVLIFSSSDEPRDVDMAHELGANGYALKPMKFDELVELVTDIEHYWLRRHCYPSLPGAGGKRCA